MSHRRYRLPTCRPLLPSADVLLPFLRAIDERRWYTNFGPLVRRFETELETRFDAPSGSVVTVANGTMGLTLALQDAAGETGGLCLVPAWTFAATPIAIRNAGLTPFFTDVDASSWQLAPDRARDLIDRMGGPVAAVVPVAPFGERVDAEAWARFAEETGVKVVIDSAAAFDTASTHPGLVSVVSLHATKVVGVGDGGFVIAGTAARADRLRRMSNFGFDADRRSMLRGTNGKMSEYSAVVGLASLAGWPSVREAVRQTQVRLHASVVGLDRVAPRSTPPIASTFNVVTHASEADALIRSLRSDGIEARKWWGDGCHRHPAFENMPREDLPVTDDLAARVVGLPFWANMLKDEIDIVAGHLRDWDRQTRDDASGSR